MATFATSLVEVVKSTLMTVPCKPLSSFNGTDPNYMAYNFTGCMNNYFALSKTLVGDEECWILFARSWMDGDPCYWFTNLMEGADKLTKLSDVLKKLYVCLGLPTSKAQLTVDFDQFVQGKNKLPKSYEELVTLFIKLECHSYALGGMLPLLAMPAPLPMPAPMPVSKPVDNWWQQPMDLMVGTTVPAPALGTRLATAHNVGVGR
ncbi:hypothetical protein BC828DRAFT_409641 [Blastocladiella britannica]|nr:hypothetical protein BC828DRAFT_409641 [Blastocladiella britannica]